MKSRVVVSALMGVAMVAESNIGGRISSSSPEGSYSSSSSTVTIYNFNGVPFDLNDSFRTSVSSIFYLPSLIMHNKRKVAGYGVLGTWATAFAYLRYVEWQMTKDTLWSRWKLNYSLLDLSTMKDESLEQLLLMDMYTRYAVSQQAFDKSALFKCFFADVEREEKMLKCYLRLSRLCNSTKITARLCATTSEKHTAVKEQHDRLVFLKVKMWNWIAQKTIE